MKEKHFYYYLKGEKKFMYLGKGLVDPLKEGDTCEITIEGTEIPIVIAEIDRNIVTVLPKYLKANDSIENSN